MRATPRQNGSGVFISREINRKSPEKPSYIFFCLLLDFLLSFSSYLNQHSVGQQTRKRRKWMLEQNDLKSPRQKRKISQSWNWMKFMNNIFFASFIGNDYLFRIIDCEGRIGNGGSLLLSRRTIISTMKQSPRMWRRTILHSQFKFPLHSIRLTPQCTQLISQYSVQCGTLYKYTFGCLKQSPPGVPPT